MNEITLKANEIFEFTSFENWCNTAQIKFKPYDRVKDCIVCVNTIGEICHTGVDFQASKDNNSFPVKAYLLKRAEK